MGKEDWRQKAIDLAQNLDSQERIDRTVKKPRKLSAQERHKVKLERLQSQFKCHVCGKLPTKPLETEFEDLDQDTGKWARGVIQNWEVPGDLDQCRNCKKWACEEHIEQSVCQECAESSKICRGSFLGKLS